jgi:hypothetical protein
MRIMIATAEVGSCEIGLNSREMKESFGFASKAKTWTIREITAEK